MRPLRLLLPLLLGASLAGTPGPSPGFVPRAAAQPAPHAPLPPLDPEHAAWTALLRRFVRDGLVDYRGLAAEGAADLDAYLASLSAVDETEYLTFSREARIAFWVNVYNAFTIRLVLDHYPIESIRSIGFLPGSAFRRRFIRMELHGGGRLSLDHVEHRILREELGEPRIHFAIVCASRSCPALRPEAYRGRDLDAQLDAATRAFLADETRNRIRPGDVRLSAIFRWFREDFEKAAGSVPAFVARFADGPAAAALRDPDVRVRYLDYDWSLNER